jgi:hypothetical protein
MRGWSLCLAVLAGGCYHPDPEAPCAVACEFANHGPCPGAMECQSDNRCRPASGSCADAADPIPADAHAAFCHGSPLGLMRVCFDAEPTQPIIFDANEVLMTDVDPRCTTYHQSMDHADDLCLVMATSILVNPGVTVLALGTRPLVLYATATIEVQGVIDVSSQQPLYLHPAGSRSCPGQTVVNAGGGAGGTYATRGGDGGGGNTPTMPGDGGISTPVVTPLKKVRGGCNGMDGSPADGGSASLGGIGGGAIYMIASSIVVSSSGAINASGSGGRNTGVYTGGGGGGSGGLIGCDAATVTIDGRIIANGGGGASGGTKAVGGAISGDDPAPSLPLQVARGHVNLMGEAGGGNGAILMSGGMTGGSVVDLAGGGGGGGGEGYFAIYAPTISVMGEVSPANTAP